MLSFQITSEIFSRLFTIPDNKACSDCQTPTVSFASLNHGIFLCSSCANFHQKHMAHISIVKSISNENWTENELNIMIMGGNIKFRNFIDIYKLPKDFTLEMRYQTIAVSFYREMMKNQLEKKLIPEPPSLEEGRKLNKNITIMNIDEINSKNKDPESEMIDKTFEIFNKMASYTKQKVKKVGETIKDPNFQEDVKFYGNKLAETSKELSLKAFSFIKEKFSENDKVNSNNDSVKQSEITSSIPKLEKNNQFNQQLIEEDNEINEKNSHDKNFANFKEDNFYRENANEKLITNPKEISSIEEERKKPNNENFDEPEAFSTYSNNFSSENNKEKPYIFPDPDDKLDMTLDFIDKGYEKVKNFDYSSKFKAFGYGFMNFSKKTYGKVQEKWQDKQFQENMHNTKDKFVEKTKELGEKTGILAKEAYENIKKKI